MSHSLVPYLYIQSIFIYFRIYKLNCDIWLTRAYFCNTQIPLVTSVLSWLKVVQCINIIISKYYLAISSMCWILRWLNKVSYFGEWGSQPQKFPVLFWNKEISKKKEHDRLSKLYVVLLKLTINSVFPSLYCRRTTWMYSRLYPNILNRFNFYFKN